MIKSFKPIGIGLVAIVLLAILGGFYSTIFAFIPAIRGLFETKPDELLQSSWYIPLFMVHIGFGTVAIITGSTQFFSQIRIREPNLHRNLGKIYVASVIPSGLIGFVIGFYATGAWYSKLGFILSGLGWLISTIIAYVTIRRGDFNLHREWMMRSYAFCFAFVTFRIYLALASAQGIPFYAYYPYISFLSWIPNLIFVEWRIKLLKS